VALAAMLLGLDVDGDDRGGTGCMACSRFASFDGWTTEVASYLSRACAVRVQCGSALYTTQKQLLLSLKNTKKEVASRGSHQSYPTAVGLVLL
jgi:hypothetical protein